MKRLTIKAISLVLLLAFFADTACYGLATLPASQNPIAKREILATLQRTQIRYAESEDAVRLLRTNNAECLLLSSGKYLVTKEVAQNDLKLLRAIIHEDVEAIMQILAKEDRYKYQGIKELILKYFPPDKDNNLPIELYVNHTVARAFEWLIPIEQGIIFRGEIPADMKDFVKAIEPIIKANKHNYFTSEFWDSQRRGNMIRIALNNGMIFYQTASNANPKNSQDVEKIIEEFNFYFQWANYDDAKIWANKLSASHPGLTKKLLSQIKADLDILKQPNAIDLLLKKAYEQAGTYNNYETADHLIAMVVRHLDYIKADTLITLIQITHLYKSWFGNDFQTAYRLLVDEHKQPTLFPMGPGYVLGNWGISFPDQQKLQQELQQEWENQQKRPEPRKLRTKTTIGSEKFMEELKDRYWTEWPIDKLPDSEIFIYLKKLLESEKEKNMIQGLYSFGEILLRIPKARAYFKVFLKAFPDNSSDHIVGFFLWNTDFRRIVTFEILKALKEYGTTQISSVSLHNKRIDNGVIDDLIVQLYLSQNKQAVLVEINSDSEDAHRFNVDIENLDDYRRINHEQNGIGEISLNSAVNGGVRNIAGFVHSLDLLFRERGANIVQKVSYDAEFTTVLLTDLLYAQLQEERTYEVKYDTSRLTASQIEIIEEYVRLLQLRSSNPDNIKLRPFSSTQGSKESLIAVYCNGKDFKGEGHVDVAIPDGELKEYLLRITGMVNIALASSNIPDNLSREDVDKYRSIMSYIQNQYKAILGEELAIPDSPEDILKVIRRIVLGLPKSLRMNTGQIEEFNRLAKQALTAA